MDGTMILIFFTVLIFFGWLNSHLEKLEKQKIVVQTKKKVKKYNDDYTYNNSEFVVVVWPLSEQLQNKIWFRECELISTEKGMRIYGTGAYLVPKKRLADLKLKT